MPPLKKTTLAKNILPLFWKVSIKGYFSWSFKEIHCTCMCRPIQNFCVIHVNFHKQAANYSKISVVCTLIIHVHVCSKFIAQLCYVRIYTFSLFLPPSLPPPVFSFYPQFQPSFLQTSKVPYCHTLIPSPPASTSTGSYGMWTDTTFVAWLDS